ncbi:hypothetical protein BAZSYMB_SCAFFOLD00117_0 [Bathymodiolus azoricus thioautotrophic gill symbiont]|uniref:Uncharacterized protein n=1 Tax=Bathymodiolus azoricus thioautotrophic gill symbiont TaxID=235205 RepID=A0A1H6KPM4_9GAMM|nr:hypothetical protein BAZSYMB_SCAFFOLD00117_0 [Bathymodiolus azoricus thioautotrophic gill symbiont]
MRTGFFYCCLFLLPWPDSKAVMQGSAKPYRPVRLWFRPPYKIQ